MRIKMLQLVVCLFPTLAWATPMSYPVGLTIGDAQQPIAMHVRMDVQPVDLPLAAYLAQPPSGDAERAVISLFQALQTKDALGVGRWLDRTAVTGNSTDVIALYHRAFNGFQGIQVIARVPVGDRVMVVWEVDGPKGRWLRAFSAGPYGDGYKADLVTSNRPVETFLLHTIEDTRKMPARYPAVAAQQGTHAVSVATGVKLEFTGRLLDYDVMTQSPPSDARLQAYGELFALFREGEIGQFAQRYDPRSQKKIIGWNKRDPREMRSWWQYVAQSRQALLLIDAGPVAVVFVAEGPTDLAPKRVIHWDWLQRKPDGSWAPVNFQRYDDIDSIFEGRAFPRNEQDFRLVVRGAAR